MELEITSSHERISPNTGASHLADILRRVAVSTTSLNMAMCVYSPVKKEDKKDSREVGITIVINNRVTRIQRTAYKENQTNLKSITQLQTNVLELG